MDLVNINTLLFAGRWVFVGLIYFSLVVVLIAVRREMGQHLRGGRALPSASPGKLVVRSPGGDSRLSAGLAIHLAAQNDIGADPSNDIILDDAYVTGKHARLRWDGVAWWLEDLGSTNGSFINRKQCPPYKAIMVPTGATLRIGEVVFELSE